VANSSSSAPWSDRRCRCNGPALGISDPIISPYRTIWYYRDLAQLYGGYRERQEQVRLFMVPGMEHCTNGVGPNKFDTITALESWVEHGAAPDGIIATKYDGDVIGSTVLRTMPLCWRSVAALASSCASWRGARAAPTA